MIYPNGPKTARSIFGVHVLRSRQARSKGLDFRPRPLSRSWAIGALPCAPSLPFLLSLPYSCPRSLPASNFRARRRRYLYLLTTFLSRSNRSFVFRAPHGPGLPASRFGRSIRLIFSTRSCQGPRTSKGRNPHTRPHRRYRNLHPGPPRRLCHTSSISFLDHPGSGGYPTRFHPAVSIEGTKNSREFLHLLPRISTVCRITAFRLQVSPPKKPGQDQQDRN